jgi:GT2 family glycosyltransferase
MTIESTGFRKALLGADVTIGIAAHGNHEVTREALSHLFSSAEGEFELILVDDCSPDDGQTKRLFEQARAQHKNTRIFVFDRNHEYSGSLNAILSHAAGDWVCFLSNDILVTPAYLDEILDVARRNLAHGIVRGCSNFVDNGLATHNRPPGRTIESSRDLFEESDFVRRTMHGKIHLDDFLTGDAFLVSRAVIDKIGTFDQLFYGYFADHDYGIRAQIAGFDLVLAQGAYAWHVQGANFDYLDETRRDQKLKQRWRRIYENWARFKLKYELPVELDFSSMAKIPWSQLRSGEFDHELMYCPPVDYTRYLV